MTYPQAIEYLESFINYEKIPTYPYKESLKLERIKIFLSAIGNPQDSLKCVHVAGTKGKGSTCAFIAYILREAGYKVGLYTSPHLSDFRERIRILNSVSRSAGQPVNGLTRSPAHPLTEFEGMVSQGELAELVKRLKPAIEKYNKSSQYGPLSFFEVYTALAFTYFKDKKTDFVVLETGLGGRLDATNAVNPYTCAITPISYEHMDKLGNTLREIAMEKVGIIKVRRLAGAPVSRLKSINPLTRSPAHPLTVISAPQEKEVEEVIRSRCKKTGGKLYEVGKDILYSHQVTRSPGHQFMVKGTLGDYPNLKIGLAGEHQIINASVAVGVIEALREYGINISIDTIRGGLYNTIWPGRCEVVSKRPLVVLDGAQNAASAKALSQAVRENFRYKKLILVLGISNDKDIKGICNELYDLADTVILTKANNPRATKPESLAHHFDNKPIYITNSVREAIKKAKDLSKEEDLILVTGSLFVVGETRERFR